MEEVSAFQFYKANNLNQPKDEQKLIKRKKNKNKRNGTKKSNSTNQNNQTLSSPEENRKRKRAKNKNNKTNQTPTENLITNGTEHGSQKSKRRKVNTISNKKENGGDSKKMVKGENSVYVDDFNIVPHKKNKKKTRHDSDLDEYSHLDFDVNESSVEQGKQMLRWVIAPLEDQKFFKHNWEQRPVHIIRHCKTYYKNLLSCELINKVLREKMLYFGKNIDLTSYENGERKTHNPEGRANAPIVWDHYNNGCSVRILNPQTFFKKVHQMNSKLQEFFGCFVGANVYLTPPDSQGFAPHYDDIEAFVLQIEGKKKWKLYGPRTDSEILPRESSPNFTEEDLGPVTMEVTLEAGDLLYFPRGVIHQASAVDGCHSLHITLSVYQKNSWANLLQRLIPAALTNAIEEDVSFRKGLPLEYLNYMGVVNSDIGSPQRAEFLNTLQTLICKLVNYAPVDAAVDQMGKQFQTDALPPCLSKEEKCRTVFGDGEIIKNGVISKVAEMQLDTNIRLLRYNALRLVTEDEDRIVVYYSINNSREYHGEEPQSFEIDEDTAPAIEHLIQTYPEYVTVEDLPVEDEIKRIQIAATLWEVGLIITEEPLAYDSD